MGRKLLLPAFDICFWNTSPQMALGQESRDWLSANEMTRKDTDETGQHQTKPRQSKVYCLRNVLYKWIAFELLCDLIIDMCQGACAPP